MTIIEELQLTIHQCQQKIKAIQDECSHPFEALTKKYKGDTGNWCRDDDSYWAEFHCTLCDKRWSADSKDKDEYHRKAGRELK